MSMKKLADAAMLELNNRMESYFSSLEPSDDDILMAAMTCRIQELEEAMELISNKAGEMSEVLSDEDCAIESTIMEIAQYAMSE